MFRKLNDISALAAHLEGRGVSLWHACQLRDFRSYLEIGGIPSRSLLEQAGLAFTGFVTDSTDRSGGVWPKVFANLSDLGSAFAHRARAVPNPYGPIVFQVNPMALKRSFDVALCLRSAGARDFDRDSESLSSLDDIERLFWNPPGAPFPEQSFLRYGEHLRTAFTPRYPDATTAEISLSMDPELIPLEDVIAVWVDPIAVGDAELYGSVSDAFSEANREMRVRTRFMAEDRKIVLADVVRYLSEPYGPPMLRSLAGRHDISSATREWVTAVSSRNLDWQFQRYASYLVDGTLRELGEGAMAEPTRRAAESIAKYRSTHAGPGRSSAN